MSEMPAVIALGFFDGVHVAHRKIIQKAVEYAKKEGLSPIVLSFDKSPLEILSDKKVSYLTTNEDKKEIISELEAEAQFLTLSHALLSMKPEEFIEEVLVKKYNIKHSVCGYNYRFGKNGRGDTSLLKELGAKHGFTVEVVGEETLHGKSISSSRIRELLTSGSIVLANELLGRNFFIKGTVCEGKQLGRTIGFPTANVFPPANTVHLKNGVYKTQVIIDEKIYPAITNVGINPTVGGEKFRTETYIQDFNKNIYNKEIRIEFLDFIRDERKFESIDDLKNQIINDMNQR